MTTKPDDGETLGRALPRFRLDDLLHGLQPGEMAGLYDWGPDIGREIVED